MISQTPIRHEICTLLYSLGIDCRYIGFYYLVYALELTVREPERLCLVTKWLYPDVAKQFGADWRAVERAMRLAVTVSWRHRSEELKRITNFVIIERPCVSCFLSILTDYLIWKKAA